jgi:hypothetical protein
MSGLDYGVSSSVTLMKRDKAILMTTSLGDLEIDHPTRVRAANNVALEKSEYLKSCLTAPYGSGPARTALARIALMTMSAVIAMASRIVVPAESRVGLDMQVERRGRVYVDGRSNIYWRRSNTVDRWCGIVIIRCRHARVRSHGGMVNRL